MQVRIKDVVAAFELLYASIHEREFRKTLPLNKYGERDLAPLVRTFLLGWFGRVSPEARSALPGSLTGQGSIDFIVDDVAIEFAVRRQRDKRAALSDVTNATEVKKLMKHPGRSVLVLYDFSKDAFELEDLQRYREWRSLGQGNHKVSAFNVAYFFRLPGSPITNDKMVLNVRPKRA